MGDRSIIQTQDGSHSIFSEQFGESYHSRYGAIRESQHVFLEAGLYPIAMLKKDIHILEIGFGTGLNAFLTLLAAEKRNLQITYEGIEAYPITLNEAKQLNYSALLGWPTKQKIFESLHSSAWEKSISINPNFTLTKHQILFQNINYQEQFDLIYFDAFAPKAQPELWEHPVLENMYTALKWEGVLVTYCAKGVVKRTLKEVGFRVQTLPGPPGKREMTQCTKVRKE